MSVLILGVPCESPRLREKPPGAGFSRSLASGSRLRGSMPSRPATSPARRRSRPGRSSTTSRPRRRSLWRSSPRPWPRPAPALMPDPAAGTRWRRSSSPSSPPSSARSGRTGITWRRSSRPLWARSRPDGGTPERRCAASTWGSWAVSWRPTAGRGRSNLDRRHLYWTLYVGVLSFSAHDPSPNQEDTLAVLDQSLRAFVSILPPKAGVAAPARSRGAL